MWFKRRRKSEQDHALSESLRSLQSLLNESGRQEPQVDTPEGDESGADQKSGSVEPAPAGDAEPRADGALNAGEPMPPEAGVRWRELSLSFDAEPVIHVPVEPSRDTEADDAEEPALEADGQTTAEPVRRPPEGPDTDAPDPALEEPDIEWQTGHDAGGEPALGTGEQASAGPVLHSSVAPEPDEPELVLDLEDTDMEWQSGDDAGEPALETGEQASAEPVLQSSVAPESDEPELVLDLEETDIEWQTGDDAGEPALEVNGQASAEPVLRPPAAPDADEPDPEVQSFDSSPDEPDHDGNVDAAPTDNASGADEMVEIETATPPSQRLEDQLDLQLEPTEQPAEEDIPTLTEAVYIPDAPAGAEPVPEPDPEPHPEPEPDTDTRREIERLRGQLQALELDTLSREQRSQLRDRLEALLDELM